MSMFPRFRESEVFPELEMHNGPLLAGSSTRASTARIRPQPHQDRRLAKTCGSAAMRSRALRRHAISGRWRDDARAEQPRARITNCASWFGGGKLQKHLLKHVARVRLIARQIQNEAEKRGRVCVVKKAQIGRHGFSERRTSTKDLSKSILSALKMRKCVRRRLRGSLRRDPYRVSCDPGSRAGANRGRAARALSRGCPSRSAAFHRVKTHFVARSRRPDSTTREPRRKTLWMVSVRFLPPRRVAELGPEHDDRFVKQPALFQVTQQSAIGTSTSAASLPWLFLISECASHSPPPPPPWKS